MTPEIDEREVHLALRVAIEATKGHRGCAPETCGGSRLDPCSLANALESLQRYQERKGYVVERTSFKAVQVREDDPVWVETTMRQCLAGDRIRIGAEETDVIRSSSGIWHADSSDAWHPRAWEHVELRMELAVVPGFTQYPPNASVEILMSPERKAVHLLNQAFPGTTVIS